MTRAQRTPKHRQVNLPDFRNVARGRQALRAMIEAADSKEELNKVAEKLQAGREPRDEKKAMTGDLLGEG